MQLRILFVQTVAMATARPTVESWHEPVLHRFDETHMRWVTIVLPPLWEASDENVITTVTARGISQFTILSLAEFGQPSQQPNASASAEPAAVAMATFPPEDLLFHYQSPLSSRMTTFSSTMTRICRPWLKWWSDLYSLFIWA